jgi:hypothetical protein
MNECIPSWVESHLVDDERFGSAYAAVADEKRAILKTLISRLWDWSCPERFVASSRERIGKDGWTAGEEWSPADWTVFVCGADLDSPARLLAAIIPAIAAGVREILVVRDEQSPWPDSLLVALELAGVELVGEMPCDRMQQLLSHMAAGCGQGRLVLLGDVDAEVDEALRPVFLPAHGDGVIVAGSDVFPDISLLRFAHPSLALRVYGDMPVPEDDSVQPGLGRWQDDCAAVAFVDNSHVQEAAGCFPLVFGVGSEFCWVWPWLRPAFFINHCVCWTNGV